MMEVISTRRYEARPPPASHPPILVSRSSSPYTLQRNKSFPFAQRLVHTVTFPMYMHIYISLTCTVRETRLIMQFLSFLLFFLQIDPENSVALVKEGNSSNVIVMHCLLVMRTFKLVIQITRYKIRAKACRALNRGLANIYRAPY